MPCDIHFTTTDTTVTLLASDKCSANPKMVEKIRLSGNEMAHASKILDRAFPVCDFFFLWGDTAREVLANWSFKKSGGYQASRPGATFVIGSRVAS